MIADKGFWGRAYAARLAANGTRLLTPDRTRNTANEQRERALASTRLVIESVYANLKGQMRLEQHLARTRRPRRPDRTTDPRAHTRDAPQHPHRPPRTRPRRL